jgi:hypothetical protein
MKNAASKRQFDILLFWSVDRFSREGIVPVLMNLKRLSKYGVRYRSYQEPFIDTIGEFWGFVGGIRSKDSRAGKRPHSSAHQCGT